MPLDAWNVFFPNDTLLVPQIPIPSLSPFTRGGLAMVRAPPGRRLRYALRHQPAAGPHLGYHQWRPPRTWSAPPLGALLASPSSQTASGEGGQQHGWLMVCWGAVAEQRSCMDEMVLFFLNGETTTNDWSLHGRRPGGDFVLTDRRQQPPYFVLLNQRHTLPCNFSSWT